MIGRARNIWFGIAAACGIAFAAYAQPPEGGSFILSDEYGRQTSVGVMRDLREDLIPAALTGAQIVDEFKRLCLDTDMGGAAHSAAASASSWGYSRHEAALPAERNRPAFAMADFRSPSAITSFWSGDNADALRGRPYATRDRGASVTGPVNPRDLYAPQCSLSLKASGLTDAAPLAAALETAIGAPATRLVVRASFADGNWVLRSASGQARRVYFQVVDLRRPEQLVHLAVQALPPGRN